MMEQLKSMLTIRGDSLYCPLSFSLDTYGNCEIDCYHCYHRRLNYIWGTELKPMDLEIFEKKITNGLKNKNPRSSLAWALKNKKTLRIGNKSDPYQPAEEKYERTKMALRFLFKMKWSVVIETRCTELMNRDVYLLSNMRSTIVVVISPGFDRDWEVFERKRTTQPSERVKHLKRYIDLGINVGVNGEPFIPGYHNVKDFENTIKILKSYGIKSYNTYNFHWNDFVIKRLLKIGIDVEKIWYYNRDKYWKPILQKLIDISKKYDIVLGCPDFVNSGNYVQSSNTCCGVNVPNPTTFNVINWKKRILKGEDPEQILVDTWDGIGDKKLGADVMNGNTNKFYTMKEIDW